MVALEQAVAAPFATRQLADLGARVIKVERPGSGDFARHYDQAVHGQSSYFVWLNRGKESIELDLKRPTARRCWPPCSAGPTCWCRTWRPARPSGRPAPAELTARHPRLITARSPATAPDGPYRQEGL